jgi:hypothetical protein
MGPTRRSQTRDTNPQVERKLRLPAAVDRNITAITERTKRSFNATALDLLAAGLSLDEDLGIALEDAASANRSAVNEEIVARLRASFHDLSFRPSPRLRQEIEAAAQYNNRSLADEIEDRLQFSFRQLLQFHEVLPPPLRAMINQLIDLILSLELFTGRKFGTDTWLHDQVKQAIAAWFDWHRPPHPIYAPKGTAPARRPLEQKLLDRLGELYGISSAEDDRWHDVYYLLSHRQLDPDVTVDDPRLLPPGEGSALTKQASDERDQRYAAELAFRARRASSRRRG